MAFTIASSVSATASSVAPTGRACGGHIQYAVNQGAYWVFYLSSTSGLTATYSTNAGSSWNTPSGSPFTLSHAHAGQGQNLALAYANISSVDVLHAQITYQVTGTVFIDAARFSLGTTWTNTNVEAQLFTGSGSGSSGIFAGSVFLDSNSKPIVTNSSSGGDYCAFVGTNVDSGSSWTAGYGSVIDGIVSANNWGDNSIGVPLASGAKVYIADNNTSNTNCTDVWYTNTWVSATNSSTSALAGVVTSTIANNLAVCKVSNTDIHLVILQNNSNTWTHRRYNGTSWSAGNIIGNLTAGTGPINLVTDGTNVWAGAIDSSKNIQYNKWNGSAWGGWTVLEATRTNTPSYITGTYNATAQQIMWSWSEVNGSNFDIIGSTLNTGIVPTVAYPAGFLNQASIATTIRM